VKLFDTHCHLTGEKLREQCDAMVERAIEQQVKGISFITVTEACHLFTPEKVKQLQEKHSDMTFVWSSGIHPHDVEGLEQDRIRKMVREGIKLKGASAVGETGLDFHYDFSDREIQKDWFSWHIELAEEFKKPLIIHSRSARQETLDILKNHQVSKRENPGILHCFTEDVDMAKTLVDWGFYISLSGIVTFKNATELKKVAQYVPVDQLLIETDSPYLAPVPKRGKTNEPAFVNHVFDYICQLREISDKERFAQQLWSNSMKAYQLSSTL